MNRIALVLVPLALLLATPIALFATGEEEPGDPAVRAAKREVAAIREADGIVVGRVVTVHESPGVWCGIVATRQEVTYRVVHHLAGKALGVGETVRVGHLLVHGSPYVRRDTPALRPELFRKGARWLLCLNHDARYDLDRARGGWIVRDEAAGARPLDPPPATDPDRAALVRLTLSLPSLGLYLHPERPGRLPVVVMLTDALPAPVDAAVGGKPVRFLPPADCRDIPSLAFEEIRVKGDRAVVRFRYAVEGVRGRVEYAKRGGAWTLDHSTVVEE